MLQSFIERHTAVDTTALVPEVRLRLATDAHAIFMASEAFVRPADDATFPPYWAFAWPGGQAMARYLLDNPGNVAGRSIVDIGAGSGIGAIAAVLAGARSVLAADIDPLAEAAIRINAAGNACGDRIATTTLDQLGHRPRADLVIISDLVYEPELALRVGAFLDLAGAAGVPVLMGDRMRARPPVAGFEEIARYAAALAPALAEDEAEMGRVWRRRNARPKRRVAPAKGQM